MPDPEPKSPAVFLMGPTASGKTRLAIEMRSRFAMDIISVDSALVYRGMDVGTAKPDAATLRRAPHALIDIRDPAETYSAAEFREDALEEMSKIAGRGRVPLLVGGTMLYFFCTAFCFQRSDEVPYVTSNFSDGGFMRYMYQRVRVNFLNKII